MKVLTSESECATFGILHIISVQFRKSFTNQDSLFQFSRKTKTIFGKLIVGLPSIYLLDPTFRQRWALPWMIRVFVLLEFL